MQKILFQPDTHVPYHDKRAWRLFLQVAKAWRPNVHVILGDFIDNYAVTSHDKSYMRKSDFQWEIDEANKALDQLEAATPRSVKHFIAGNHEDRWPRYLAAQSPSNNLRTNTMRVQLRLDERGYNYVEYKDYLTLGKLNITHDTGKAGKNAVQQSLDDFQANVVIGHLHRMGVFYSGDARGKTHVGACFGWLGDRRQVDYMHRVKANRDWQLGFGLGYQLASGQVHLQAVPIVDYKCVVDGVLYKG